MLGYFSYHASKVSITEFVKNVVTGMSLNFYYYYYYYYIRNE